MISTNIKQINSCLKYPIIFDKNNKAILSSDLILIKYQYFTYIRYNYAIAEYVLINNSIQLLYHTYSHYAFHMFFHKTDNYSVLKIEDNNLNHLNELSKQEILFLKKRKKSVYYRSNWHHLPEITTDVSEKYAWNSGFATYIGLSNNKQHIDFLYLNK